MVEDTFNSAHFLKNYDGNCKNMHGHNFKVQLFVYGETLNEIGLLMDYKILKQELKAILSPLDHHLLNEVLTINPTSENLAQYIYEQISSRMPIQVKVAKVAIWESDKACASYFIH